jgi:hypothetical protein
VAYPWEEEAALAEEEGGPPKPNAIEQGIVLAANAVWAVVGLLLWLPQLARVVLLSSVRIVHSALTRQPVETARGPIRRVSRFYLDGFLKPGRTWNTGVFSARDLALRRLVGEAAWAGVFYLLLLRLLDPIGFAAVWSRLTDWGARLVVALRDLAVRAWGLLPDALSGLREAPNTLRLTLAAFVLLAFLGGLLLGRGRRRRR